MPVANQFGIDLPGIYQAKNALMAGQQQQQMNALALQKGQMDLENAPALNALALKKSNLEVSGMEQNQAATKHAADVKATTDTLGALDAVPDEQLAQATQAAKANLVSQGITTAALDQAWQQSGGDPVKLRPLLKQAAIAGLGYAKQLEEADKAATRDQTAANAKEAGRHNQATETQAAAASAASLANAKASQGQAAASLAETQRHNKATEATAAATAQQNQGKLTEDQAKSGGFADRATEGDLVLSSPEAIAAGTNLKQQAASKIPLVGNYAVSNDFQTYDQAARNFINAQLRRDSGAAISDSEWDNARKQYLPQPGDGDAVLKQKAENRQTAIGGLIRSAGKGYVSAVAPKTKTADALPKGVSEDDIQHTLMLHPEVTREQLLQRIGGK